MENLLLIRERSKSLIILLCLGVSLAFGQSKKKTEIGLGTSLINWTRVNAYGYSVTNIGHKYDIDIKHFIPSVQLYFARELNKWFYIDFTGGIGIDHMSYINKTNLLYDAGLGLQFRFTSLTKQNHVEPYIRVGTTVMYKNFSVNYAGVFPGAPAGEAHWNSSDLWNKQRKQDFGKFAFPLNLGIGVNSWITNSFGIGLSGNYLLPTQRNKPAFASASIRLMLRFGNNKKENCNNIPQYIIIEKPVEKIKKIIEVIKEPVYDILNSYLSNIYFDFDKSTISPQSEATIDKIFNILKKIENKRFLIIGYTDTYGSQSYNKRLSHKRAKAVYDALVKRGINPQNLKFKGVGKGAALLNTTYPNSAREGDRKVSIEIIDNISYWNSL